MEREKIEKIRSFKATDTDPAPPSKPLISKKPLIYVGLALLLLVIVLFKLK